jgi:hypothetical protein
MVIKRFTQEFKLEAIKKITERQFDSTPTLSPLYPESPTCRVTV